MKRLICIIISLLMIFTFLSCDEIIETPNTTDSDLTTDIPQSEKITEKQTTKKETTKKESVKKETTTTKETNATSSNNNASISDLDNGILKDTSADTMNVPENMKFLGTKDATEEKNSANIKATVVAYTLDGEVVNWATENDFLYVITKGNNRLVIIDSRSMKPVYNTALSGVPAEMNIIGDDILISFPDLMRIDIFSKTNCTKKSSIYFEHEISSFCIDGDYIYYTEHDQHCKVFKKNLTTNAIEPIANGTHGTFYFPKIYLNKEDRILYIGESNSTGSAIYYYDADTLEQKSVFKKNNYGIMNHTREIFHVDDMIFWGNFCLSDTVATQLIGRYGTADYGSVVFASNELVSTYEGLFLTDTYECIINYFDAKFEFEHLIVSKSYNLFFRRRTLDKNIIIGLNFDVQ